MKPTVLVVDDDAAIRDLLREVLEMDGYVVSTAAHGGPALERLRAADEGLVVLLDLLMPYVDGEEVLRAVADEPALATRHRFILMTAASNLAARSQATAICERLGIPNIGIPFDINAMLTAVERAAATLA